MKKTLLSLGLACACLTSFASTRIIYQQNYEDNPNLEDAGWKNGGAQSLSVVSADWGKYLEANLGQNNGRSVTLTWGQDIFMENGQSLLGENGTYNIYFEFAIAKGSNNQYNGAMTVFTNHAPVNNQPYRNPWSPAGYWENYLFDMSQVDKESMQFAINGGTITTTAEDGTVSRAIDYSDPTTLDPGMWYKVTLTVNVNDRTSEYLVTDLANEEIKSGFITVPETDVNGDPISMYAEGLELMLARYQTVYQLDNLKVYIETDYDVANPPVVALTRFGMTEDEKIDLNLRAYTINFMEEETLHITGTDGKTINVDYDECEGTYVYEATKSGVMKAWTTCGTATSEVVETEVDCNPYVLPVATATISSVGQNYIKTYTLNVDNSDVPLRPTISMSYEFIGKNGEKLEAEDLLSGAKVSVTQEGTLKITTSAAGYQENVVEVVNKEKFKQKNAWDFARMTKEEIAAAGFPSTFEVLNSSKTSGFDNWTARKRLYYEVAGSEHQDEEGNTVVDKAYPFGFVSEDNTVNVIEYSVIDRSADAEYDSNAIFAGLTIFPDKGKVETGLPNIGMIYRLGLYNNQTTNNNNNVIINGLDKYDFVSVNYINGYGSNSCHPTVATDDEYFKVLAGEDAVYSVAKSGTANEDGTYSLTHALYRIDTLITKITVFEQDLSGVEEVAGEVAGDGFYYTVDGIRLAEPNRPGLYIRNGKKVIVK